MCEHVCVSEGTQTCGHACVCGHVFVYAALRLISAAIPHRSCELFIEADALNQTQSLLIQLVLPASLLWGIPLCTGYFSIAVLKHHGQGNLQKSLFRLTAPEG